MALKVAGLICFILCVHGACLQIQPPSKQIEPARKLLAQALASGPMNIAVGAPINSPQRRNQEQGPPLLSRKLLIIVPFLHAILVAIVLIFRRRKLKNAELSAAAPNNITYNFNIIGALFSAT